MQPEWCVTVLAFGKTSACLQCAGAVLRPWWSCGDLFFVIPIESDCCWACWGGVFLWGGQQGSGVHKLVPIHPFWKKIKPPLTGSGSSGLSSSERYWGSSSGVLLVWPPPLGYHYEDRKHNVKELYNFLIIIFNMVVCMVDRENILHSHLGHGFEGSEVFIGKALLVLAHFDGIQPFVHCAETGEVWCAAVQQR